MRLYKRKGSPKWWATWYQDGKQHRRSTGTDDRKIAQALTSKWVQENFLEDQFGKKPDLPFSEALLRYAKAQKRVTFHDTKNSEDRSVRLCARTERTLLALGPKEAGPVFTFNGKATRN